MTFILEGLKQPHRSPSIKTLGRDSHYIPGIRDPIADKQALLTKSEQWAVKKRDMDGTLKIH